MSTTKLIISDLHLADGTSILDCFGERQQAALEGLLAAAASPSSSFPFSPSEEVELIINGDCFDFLVTTPYNSNKTTHVTTAVQKIDKIIAAHRAFFATLRAFVALPGRRVTFVTGNHDLELCFAEVHTRIRAAIIGSDEVVEGERIHFCPTRFYRPLPDVYIEHGNNYDFWNHAIQGIWDEQGQPLDRHPQTLALSAGSQYFQRAAYPISVQHAYFDHFDPPMNSMRQIALLCLLDPDLLIHVAQATMQLLSSPRQPLANLSLEDRRNPVRLFDEAIQDFAAFQTDMAAQKRDWPPVEPPQAPEATQPSQAVLQEFMTIHQALALPIVEAVAVLCTPRPYQMGADVASGMHNVLKNDPTLRYAIAGHTHEVRSDSVGSGGAAPQQVYLNTGSWTTHLALPTPEDITAATVEWFRAPAWNAVPLRDITQFVFVLVTSSQDEASTARLCVWDGATHGNYRVLA